jgi:Zn-dependent protease with chaperone function
MYLFIIVGLVTSLVSLDLWGGGPSPQAAAAVAGAVIVAALVFLAGLGLGAYVLWRPGALAADPQRFLRRVRVLGRLYRLLVLAANAFILGGLGWAPLAARWAGGSDWDTPAAALAVAPFAVLAGAAWTAVYWADRALRAALFEQGGVVMVAGQWTLPRYLEFMFRQYLLVLLVPLLALLGLVDVVAHVWGPLDEGPLAAVLSVALVVGATLLAGPWVRICWRTAPLPDSELRRRLEALADRAGIRVGEILVWRTNHTIANGCMIGMLGPLRYILITDALLLAMAQTPEEAEAVFAHEVGHVKHHHTLLYAGLAMGGVALAFLAGQAAAAVTASLWLADGAAAAVMLAYWWLGFGFISRRCELEADLYAARATQCPQACSPPDAGSRACHGVALASRAAAPVEPQDVEWPVGAVAGGPCWHRVMVFTNALARIARLNGSAETARGWRHFSVARRRAWLRGLAENPAAVARFERRLRRIKRVALVFSIGLAVVAAIFALAAGVAAPSDADHPEHPAGPEDVRPERPTWLVRFIDGNQVDAVALRTPEFDRYADAPADPDHGRLAGLRADPAAADHEVAVADARGHAVAVHAQGEGAGADRRKAR